MNKKILILCATFVLAACAGPSRTVKEGVQDPGPRVVVNPLPAGERMTVGIARFTNESIYGSGLFTDAAGDRIGKQAADLLARHLMATQRFNVVERQDIGKLSAEADLMGLSNEQFKQSLTGVD